MVELAGARIYLDANAFIAYAEDYPQFGSVLENLFRNLETNDIEIVTSELTVAELLVAPLRERRNDLVQEYEELTAPRPNFRRIPVSLGILRLSAQMRAHLGLKLPDAIHVATGTAEGCKIMVSEDARLRVPAPMVLCRVADLDTGGRP